MPMPLSRAVVTSRYFVFASFAASADASGGIDAPRPEAPAAPPIAWTPPLEGTPPDVPGVPPVAAPPVPSEMAPAAPPVK